MLRGNLINKDEAVLLSHMINNGNQYLVGAYELFEHDGDMDDLQDTMIRCVRVELRKRSSDKQVSQRDNEYSESSTSDDDDSSTSTSDSDSSEDSSSDDDMYQQVRPTEKDDSFEVGDLTQLMAHLNIKNVWSKVGVPAKFIA